MANLKEVRNSIVSVNNTMQITSAMKMVSASKLRKAQDAVTQMRPYALKLQEVLQGLSSGLDTSENEYGRASDGKNVLIVAVTSNRGLCGGFNSQVIKRVNKMIETTYSGKNITVLTFGKKAEDAYRKTDYFIKGTLLPRNTNEIFEHLDYAHASAAASKIMDAFAAKQFDSVVLVYNHFKNAATQIVMEEQFLPIAPLEASESVSTSDVDYLFEPSKEEIVSDLIPKSLKTQFYKALLDSHAGEHGARMTAMHKATDNATEMVKDLKLRYNKARQAAITTEILEIVGGAEALNN
ncbi:MAG TPA: ATP synthase F1 subunit gamma [Flavobacteriales bacterium]|jgi:F-type H+-transporting ATPase subunit gamma|nr:ATP synthase F1 subunit gamma [Flavobacteriales bacterium]HAW20822.1 ATP synthase F1 subunit gamma [Flavobacteriales bacterium]